LLALKLSEIELFQNETGHRPLFLLDDFSSELDRERSSFLLQFLLESDLQTFVTTTEDSSSYGKKYRVHNGMIEEGFA
jgi:DNA replication and repair protein RecF